MRSPPEADAIHRHRTGLAPEIAILNGGVRPDLLDCPKWLALAPPAFALASPSPRPGGARAKAGGAVPLVEPELSPLSLSTVRETLDDGNADAQVTTLGQRDPIDYPNRSAVDYLDHAQLAGQGMKARVSLVGEGNEVVEPGDRKTSEAGVIGLREKANGSEECFTLDGKEFAEWNLERRPIGPLIGLSLPGHRHGVLAEVFARVSEILAKDNASSLEKRILSAVQWAGRATVDVRNEEAFLLYMISLESLVLGGKNAAELTFRLRLRASHLIGRTLQSRKIVRDRLKDLYATRSNIVHSGRFFVTERELLEAREYTKRALLAVLYAKPFCDMGSEDQLELWFEDRLMDNADDRVGNTSNAVDPEAVAPSPGLDATPQ